MPDAKLDRNGAITDYYIMHPTASMANVGKEFGKISRQRVQQILHKNGVIVRPAHRPKRNINIDEVIAIVRNPAIEHFTQIISHYSEPMTYAILMRCLKEEHYLVKLKRLFKLRRRWRLLRELQTIAEQLGVTPTKHKLDECGYYATKYQREFGSLYRAQELAGLIPNSKGRHHDSK